MQNEFYLAISRAEHLLVVNRLLNIINILCTNMRVRRIELKNQPTEMISEAEKVEKLILEKLDSLSKKGPEEDAGAKADIDREKQRLEGTVVALLKLLRKDGAFRRLIGKERQCLDLQIKQTHHLSEIQSLKQEILRLKMVAIQSFFLNLKKMELAIICQER